MKKLYLIAMLFALFASPLLAVNPVSAKDKNFYQDKIDFEDVVIAISTTTSAAVDLRGTTLTGIYMPAAFTGTAITFTASTSLAGTYVAVYDGAGTQVSKTVAASQYIKLDPADFAGIQFLKIVSGSTEAAERTITLAIRPVN